jgi:hypothetical protein
MNIQNLKNNIILLLMALALVALLVLVGMWDHYAWRAEHPNAPEWTFWFGNHDN